MTMHMNHVGDSRHGRRLRLLDLARFQLAEDAAQEAFLEAYRNLDKLREPPAFPGWFRRIVFKHATE